jgi:hypothetical protein
VLAPPWRALSAARELLLGTLIRPLLGWRPALLCRPTVKTCLCLASPPLVLPRPESAALLPHGCLASLGAPLCETLHTVPRTASELQTMGHGPLSTLRRGQGDALQQAVQAVAEGNVGLPCLLLVADALLEAVATAAAAAATAAASASNVGDAGAGNAGAAPPGSNAAGGYLGLFFT